MRIVIFGDIYGRIGRKAFKKELPGIKTKYKPDFIISNVDNITSGRGVIEKLILELKDLGVDALTGGDHVFDNEKHLGDYLDKKDSILLRPANFYETDYYKIPGVGYKIFKKNGKRLLVIHLLGEVFMKFNVYNPFIKAEEIIASIDPASYDGIVIDFHKETTAEGYGLGTFLDGKVSFVCGTHTHIQTNDETILGGGTGLISDVGMVGALDSIIGADYLSVKKRFITGINKGKIKQELSDNYIVNAVYIEIEDKKCVEIEKIRIKGTL